MNLLSCDWIKVSEAKSEDVGFHPDPVPAEKSEKTSRKHERKKRRKRSPHSFHNLVLSDISPAQLNLFTFNRGVFVISSLGKASSKELNTKARKADNAKKKSEKPNLSEIGRIPETARC